MICRPCVDGGDISRAIRLGFIGKIRPEAPVIMATSFHAGCRGATWCDCQHRPAPGTHSAGTGAEGVPR